MPTAKFDVIIHAVAHQEFLELDYNNLKNTNAVIYDIKGVLGEIADAKL